MKQTNLTGVILILLFFMATTAMAVDVATLDQVSVLMSKGKVLSILGTPDEKGTVSMGLTAEIYKLTDTPGSDPYPMLGAGCVYDTGSDSSGRRPSCLTGELHDRVQRA